MIEVEAVLRSLDLANSGERAIEAVAEPVDGESDDNDPQRTRVPTRKYVPGACGNHRRHRQAGEMV